MVPLKIDLPEHFLDEEIRCGYTITKHMKEIWAIELDLLSELQRVFEKYNIPYFAYAGTVLGAVRHNGFIPWDDDIDLIVNRENFEKLCKVAKKEFESPYFFQTEETDTGCCIGLAKLRNSDTTMILRNHENRNFRFNQGIFIDIFVYDNVPENEIERNLFFKEIDELKSKSLKFRNTFHCDKTELNTVKGQIKNFLEKMINLFNIRNPYYYKLSSLCQKYNNITTKIVADCFSFPVACKILDKNSYEESIYMPFEFLKLPVPKNYDEHLTMFFGDWRTPMRIAPKHGLDAITNTSESYKFFFRKNKK